MTQPPLVESLALEPHPEGGWYRQTWVSPETVTLPDGRVRPTATLIHFYLPAGESSAWHRVRSDEVWLAHQGSVTLEYGGTGTSPTPERSVHVGTDLAAGQVAQAVVGAGEWQRTTPSDADAWVSCLVSPGFDFEDFELSATLQGAALIVAARDLAIEKHAECVDKTGQPYITHPARVAKRVADRGPEVEAVAWLHDVIEDCGVTDDDLRKMGFPESVIAGVVAMTKVEGDAPLDPVRRACAHPIGLVVKSADVADNTDPNRPPVAEPKRTELIEKYAGYREVLAAHGAPPMPVSVVLGSTERRDLGLM